MSTMDMSTSPLVTIVTRDDGSAYAVPRFVWDANAEQAAMDLAEGQLRLGKIAERAGIHTGALAKWRQHPEFKERVEQNRKMFREQVLSFGLARKEARLSHLQERHDRILATVQARAEHFASLDKPVPGAEHGYVYEHVTQNGVEYMIDNKTAAMLGDIEKQAAIEVGEWSEGSSPAVAVQIVCPASAPDASKAPTVTIGGVR